MSTNYIDNYFNGLIEELIIQQKNKKNYLRGISSYAELFPYVLL